MCAAASFFGERISSSSGSGFISVYKIVCGVRPSLAGYSKPDDDMMGGTSENGQ